MTRLGALMRAATLADGIVVVAALTLIAALLYPTWRARAFRERLASAIADVDTVSAAARQSRATQGRWPASSQPGQPPPQLVAFATPPSPFTRPEYTLEWSTWQVVDSVEALQETRAPPAPGDPPRPPADPRMLPVARSVGAVAVHAGDEALLAELLAHYGSEASFVLDTIWMIVLPERSEGPLPDR